MPTLKILVIEDMVITALSLRNTLEKNGHIVTAIARTQDEALESARTFPPDIALVDIILEGEDTNGIDIVRELYRLRPIPVVYLTANTESEQFRQAQATHPSGYLLKPFEDNALIFNIELAYHNFRQADTSRFGEARISPLLEGRFMLPVNNGLEMVDISDIMYLKAAGSYAEVILANGIRYLVSISLKQLEKYFVRPDFFRLSRFSMVNLLYIKRLKENQLLLLDDKTVLTVPDDKKKELLNRLNVVRTSPNK